MLTKCVSFRFYGEHIRTDKVKDNIVDGRKRYPIADLCSAFEYSAAYDLLEKGYQCLHEDTDHVAKEFANLLHSFTRNVYNNRHESDSVPKIARALFTELRERRQSNHEHYPVLVNAIGKAFENPTSSQAYVDLDHYACQPMQLISYLREHALDIYYDLITYGAFDLETLIQFDTEFVKNYMKNLKDSGSLSAFEARNKLSEEASISVLQKSFACYDMDIYDNLQANLFEIFRYCPDIFPSSFTADVVVLFMIGRFRVASHNKTMQLPSGILYDREIDVIDPYVDDPLNVLIPDFSTLFNRLLKHHLKPDYTFDRVARVLISCCDPNSEIYCSVHDSDFATLDFVATTAEPFFAIDRFRISRHALDIAPKDWDNLHPDKADDYTVEVRPEVKRITDWFTAHCNVIP